MKIVVAVRCYNEEKNIERFLRGYSFADKIIISDGGSADRSLEILEQAVKNSGDKISLFHFDHTETVEGETWNEDAPHMNFVMDKAKELDPDWLILDDMDCVPNRLLRENARDLFPVLSYAGHIQVNVFRLYMWGEKEYFPYMNRNFDPLYRSLWAWRPRFIDIHADPSVRHGTIVGITEQNYGIPLNNCLLHRSWHPDTIDRKIARYNALGLTMFHPLDFAGAPEPLPEWATE